MTVPIFIKVPAKTGVTRIKTARTLDVFSTMAEYLEVKSANPEMISGRSLLGL